MILRKIRLHVLLSFTIIAALSACNKNQKENMSASNSHALIAQVDTTPKELLLDKVESIKELIAKDKGFSMLYDVMQSASFTDTKVSEQGYTIFAPANPAFEKLPEGMIEKMIASKDTEHLTEVLKGHIIPREIDEKLMVATIKKSRGSIKLKTLSGSFLTATLKGDTVFLIDKNGNGGKLVTTDIKASNGLLHTLNTVMMPKK